MAFVKVKFWRVVEPVTRRVVNVAGPLLKLPAIKFPTVELVE